MATPVIVRNAVDAWTNAAAASKNYGQAARLYVEATGGTGIRHGFIYFGRVWPRGANIISAKLRLYNGDTGWTGSQQIDIQRISAKWSANRINHNNKPGVTGSTVSLTKSGAADGTMWEFDVTTLIQTVADSGNWYGFRIASNTTAHKFFYSAQAVKSAYRPVLEVQWSDKPDPPEDLRPDGNRAVSIAKPTLRFDYTDVSGDTDLAAVQVQINATDVWTSPSFDSGEVAASEPQLDLAATAYAGLAVDASTYWRVRVKDGAGLWSNWSQSARFQRKSRGTFTLVNPASSPNNKVWEPTPPIDWTFTGQTQRAYQVIVTRQSNKTDWLWTSGKITGTTTVVTIPTGTLKKQIENYTLIVRLWDTIDREGTPGDKVYYEIERDFVYDYDATVNPVTSLNGTADPDYPWMKLTWSRAAQPDEWAIVRDDEVIEDSIDGSALFVSGTSYEYIDKWVPGRQNHTWKVMAIVNHKQSSSNPTFVGKVDPVAPWLTRRDGSDAVTFLNPVHTEEMKNLQAVLETMGARPGILVTQALRGYSGHLEGVFADAIVSGLSARDMRNRFRQLRRDTGVTFILYLVDETLKVVTYNMTVRPISHPSGVYYYASFDFIEVD